MASCARSFSLQLHRLVYLCFVSVTRFWLEPLMLPSLYLCTSHSKSGSQNLLGVIWISLGSPLSALSSSPNAVAYIWFVFCNFLIHSASSASRRATSLSIYILFSFSSLILRMRSYRCYWRCISFYISLCSAASSFWFLIIYFML